MDATPAPQSVGREFVRQYYTLLNKAPHHLHRFYNNNSSFVHGGLDQHNREAPIVVGQKNIHNKIQQLNFNDCHAKISQVDSQATLGNGVVVQVTGELSNDGQPMRRFTQTFVLAAQSPKKYYVHNDIFRYQDFYSDDEVDGESGGRSENDDELPDSEPIESSTNISQPPQIFYPLGVQPAAGQNVPIQPFAQPAQMNGVVHEDILQGIPGQANPLTIPITPATLPPQAQQPQQQPPPQETAITIEPIAASTSPATVIPTNVPSVEENIEIPNKMPENIVTPEPSPVIEKDPIPDPQKIIENSDQFKDESLKSIANEPKTYANLVKSGVSGLSFASATASSPPSIVSGNSTRQNTLSPPPVRYHNDDQRRNDSGNSGSGPMPQRNNNRPMNRERRSSNTNNQPFGDNYQLFVGNVPHHATEDELRTLFSKFGTVADLRIHSKQGPKVPGGRAPPNYGFITYDDPDSVQNCLANTPLYYPDNNSSDGQKLNIEEKKTRSRAPNDLGGGGGGMSNNMRGNNGPTSRPPGTAGGLSSGPSSVRGVSNQGLSRGGPPGGRGGGGGRGGFNRTERGGSSVSRSGGNNGGTPNTTYGRRN